MKISCLLNSKPVDFTTYSDKPLNLLLSEESEVTSITPGCSKGRCGNCIVLIDEKPRLSCLVPAFQISGKSIQTFEGFAKSKWFTDIRRAYEKHAMHPCPYCYAAKSLLIHSIISDNTDPSPEEILQAMKINSCTCISEDHLVEIVKTASMFRRRRRRVRRS
ncbi:MAG: hypothetical protein K9M84_05895 [Spirochaetia bacterium]|nr:hypothetical protein [Spirochaetia bacterium]